MYIFIFAILAFLLLVIVWSIIDEMIKKNAKGKRFKTRRVLQVEEIRKFYFPDLDEKEFDECWRLIGKTLLVHPGKLRPEDRFDDKLRAVGEGAHSEYEDFDEFFFALAEEKGMKLSLEETPTIRLFIERMCSKSFQP